MITLGRLERVNVRAAWTNEAIDFTPWLAANLDLLSEALGMNLELEMEEKYVGTFRADILARNSDSGEWVLIENQLDRTDHGHLGQIVTYAAGLDAATVIWIAENFSDEHLAALDWLNSITDENILFFGVQIELWSIGGSVAPKFQVVCKPNSWVKKAKNLKKVLGDEELDFRVESEMDELMDRYPGLQQWVTSGQRSVTIEDIVRITGHTPHMVRRREKEGVFKKTKRPGTYRLDSVISWLKVAPLPRSKEAQSEVTTGEYTADSA